MDLSFSNLLRGYRAGSLDPRRVVAELVELLRSTPAPEVWISLPEPEIVLARAEMLCLRLQERGERVFAELPLFGLPFSIKDNIDMAGLPTTAACPAFAYHPGRSAAAVERLEAAGAICLGKTNLDQFATGLTGTRSPYGTVRNPFHPDYISGGSSSGAALSVAGGSVAFALGTDTAGSGRVPAGFCNLVGLKPTPGLVSTRGVFPACRSLDCVSVFALTVADAWRVLQVIAGFDPEDPYSRSPAALPPARGPIRIGVPAELDFGTDRQAAAAFAASLKAVAEDPAVAIADVDFSPFAETAALLYQGPWIAERRAVLGDFFEQHGERMDPTVRGIIARGDAVGGPETFVGLHRLEALRRRAAEAFERFDFLLVPTAPSHYTIAEIAEAPVERNTHLGRYTNFVNLLGLSALALPGLFRADGLPAGLTFIAPGGGDHRLAEFARSLEPRLHRRLGTSTGAPPRCPVPLEPLPAAEPATRVAVVGAHLSGEPLNGQLADRGAVLVRATRTAPRYRLYALPGTIPPKPGLVRCAGEGHAIEVEVWELPLRQFGSFVAEIPPPLAIGTLELADGERVQGFLCEAFAVEDAEDISGFGGWRAYRRAVVAESEGTP
jgi:allophanate hydrolase